ncbi:MAG: thioredoxin-dependent thiol peroxidase [Methanimicrococcus sp.]|nr:thioredoxin-dependent thiol peroxidase [Methanimicrococcus sp.]
MTSSFLKEGDIAPDFCLPDSRSEKICLKDFKSGWVVLYFYPKDGTAGCKQEAVDFSAAKEEFEENGAVVLGVSKDTVVSHQKFIEKNGLTVTLLADTDLTVVKAFDVWKLKKFMGKESMGTVRTTFLIGAGGEIEKVWNNVRVKGHVDEVLRELKERKGKGKE